MQPLPTEAGPLTNCSQCGNGLPRPTGSPTFVYGVGPVGYQNCPACGAKWRYLWAESKATTGSTRRPSYGLIGGLVVAVVLAVAAFVAFRGGSSSAFPPAPSTSTSAGGSTVPGSTSTSSGGTPTTPTSSGGTPTTAPAPGLTLEAAAIQFNTRFVPMTTARRNFMEYVRNDALASAVYDVNRNVTLYVTKAHTDLKGLAGESWPPPAKESIAKLVTAYNAFLANAEFVREPPKLNAPSFRAQLEADNVAVKNAAAAAEKDLGPRP